MRADQRIGGVYDKTYRKHLCSVINAYFSICRNGYRSARFCNRSLLGAVHDYRIIGKVFGIGGRRHRQFELPVSFDGIIAHSRNETSVQVPVYLNVKRNVVYPLGIIMSVGIDRDSGSYRRTVFGTPASEGIPRFFGYRRGVDIAVSIAYRPYRTVVAGHHFGRIGVGERSARSGMVSHRIVFGDRRWQYPDRDI